MELQISFSFTGLAIFLVFFSFLFRLLVREFKTSKLPPGPWKLPLIGNLHQMISLPRLPHRALAELAKKHGDLMHLQLGEMSIVVASSAKMAKELLKNNDLAISDRPELLATKIIGSTGREIAFSPYGDYWKQMRKVTTTELLSNTRVQLLFSVRSDETSNLIQSIRSSPNPVINLTEMIFVFTSSVICRAAFGGKSEHQLAFVDGNKRIMELEGGFGLADIFPSLKLYLINGMKGRVLKAYRDVATILDHIINEHKQRIMSTQVQSEKEDLVDVLLRLMMSGDLDIPITIEDIKSMIWTIFGGGSDTSNVTIIWVMAELMKNPRVMEKAQTEIREKFKGKKTINEKDIRELSYMKMVIKETLRLHPPAPLLLPRVCVKQFEINNCQIPVKTNVIINCWAIGRDPEVWDDAETFLPERFADSFIDFIGNDFELIPFGAGRRICPGMSFGMANVELPLAQLLYHFNWKLPQGIEPDQFDMTEEFGAAVRRKDDLYLVATPYITP